MIRYLVCWLVVVGAAQVARADDSLMHEFIKDFGGRWTAESVADQDVEGYWKKGDKLATSVVYSPVSDLSGVEYRWEVEREGGVNGTAQGVVAWDPEQKQLRRMSFAKPAFFEDTMITKEGDVWIFKACVTFPDGSKASEAANVSISEDGETQTAKLTDRVSSDNASMPEMEVVWSRVTKNKEMLEQHVSWLIGTWTSSVDTSLESNLGVRVTYEWVAKGNLISEAFEIGNYRALNLILYDPSDEKIKLWGGNSAGGNTQAEAVVKDNEVTWEHRTCDPLGRMRAGDVTFIRKSDALMHVLYTDAVTGEDKEIPLSKQLAVAAEPTGDQYYAFFKPIEGEWTTKFTVEGETAVGELSLTFPPASKCIFESARLGVIPTFYGVSGFDAKSKSWKSLFFNENDECVTRYCRTNKLGENEATFQVTFENVGSDGQVTKETSTWYMKIGAKRYEIHTTNRTKDGVKQPDIMAVFDRK